MSKKSVTVNKPNDPENSGLLRQIEDALNRIRNRAYSFFEARGGGPGASLDDWLRAERDLFQIPESDLSETDSSYTLKTPVTGFTADQLSVAVDSRWVTLRGKAQQEEKSGESAGFKQQELFCRFELGSAIDVDNVKASLEDGTLQVTMRKAAIAEPQVQAKTEQRTAAQGA